MRAVIMVDGASKQMLRRGSLGRASLAGGSYLACSSRGDCTEPALPGMEFFDRLAEISG